MTEGLASPEITIYEPVLTELICDILYRLMRVLLTTFRLVEATIVLLLVVVFIVHLILGNICELVRYNTF